MTVSKDLKILNHKGLHARAAAAFVKVAERFESAVEVERGGQKVNGCSIMGLMMLAASQGTTITIMASGSDETSAISALSDLVADGFGEE